MSYIELVNPGLYEGFCGEHSEFTAIQRNRNA